MVATITFDAAANANVLNMPEGWETIEVPNKDPTRFAFVTGGEVEIAAANSVAFLYKELGNAERPAVAAWRWRVDKNIPATDQAARSSDDRAVAVHFWFDTGDRSSTLFGRVAQLFGYPKVSHAITYVWGGVRGAGSVLRNPYFPNGAIIILRDRSALSGRWYDERRDLAVDLRRAFGDAVGVRHLRYVALSGDTDDTATRSLARVSDLLLIADEDTR